MEYEKPDTINIVYPIGGPIPRGRAVSASAVKADAFCMKIDNTDRKLLKAVADFCEMDRSTFGRWAVIQLCRSIVQHYERTTGQPFPR